MYDARPLLQREERCSPNPKFSTYMPNPGSPNNLNVPIAGTVQSISFRTGTVTDIPEKTATKPSIKDLVWTRRFIHGVAWHDA